MQHNLKIFLLTYYKYFERAKKRENKNDNIIIIKQLEI